MTTELDFKDALRILGPKGVVQALNKGLAMHPNKTKMCEVTLVLNTDDPQLADTIIKDALGEYVDKRYSPITYVCKRYQSWDDTQKLAKMNEVAHKIQVAQYLYMDVRVVSKSEEELRDL